MIKKNNLPLAIIVVSGIIIMSILIAGITK